MGQVGQCPQEEGMEGFLQNPKPKTYLLHSSPLLCTRKNLHKKASTNKTSLPYSVKTSLSFPYTQFNSFNYLWISTQHEISVGTPQLKLLFIPYKIIQRQFNPLNC